MEALGDFLYLLVIAGATCNIFFMIRFCWSLFDGTRRRKHPELYSERYFGE